MTRNATNADPTAYGDVTDVPAAASRPSKNNCTSGPTDAETDDSTLTRRYWWKRKNEVVDRILDELPDRANRPASVREGVALRDDCTLSRQVGGHRAAPMSGVVREFLSWYNGYRHAHLLFENPDGELVRSKLENSHQPGYGNRYYARFKALERQVVEQYDDPHSVILTFSGSHRNGDGGWRCPVDHLRDVVETWRPDRGRGVYHKVRDALDGMEWEYCVAVEHNSAGYGHVHVGIFADGEVSESQFRPAIDRHLKLCEIAHPDAHDYHHSDPEKKPISVNRINPDADPADHDGRDDVQALGNLGSYLAEYIGATADSELFDRDPEELFFRASCWASGTQRVRFSTGANEMIGDDLDRDRACDVHNDPRWQPGTTPEMIEAAAHDDDRKVTDLMEGIEGRWTMAGIGRVDEDGEETYECQHNGIRYNAIAGAEHLDPPAPQPSRPPTPTYEQATITDPGS